MHHAPFFWRKINMRRNFKRYQYYAARRRSSFLYRWKVEYRREDKRQGHFRDNLSSADCFYGHNFNWHVSEYMVFLYMMIAVIKRCVRKLKISPTTYPFETPDNLVWAYHNEIFEISMEAQPEKPKFAARPKISGRIRLSTPILLNN